MGEAKRRRWPSVIAGSLAVVVFAAGVRWGAMVAGGADSYGYVSQAGLWLRGLPTVRQDVVRGAPWPDAAETWSPLAYRPSPREPDTLVPIYPPGLPLLMALFQAVGGYCAGFFVVPLSGALTVWLTFALGRRVFGRDGVALFGALLVAASPVFLYQLMNAMSDVPVTAFCALAFVLAATARPVMSGAAMSVALAIRPNLAPLAIVIGVWVALTRAQDAVRFGLALVPVVVATAWLNGTLYESPFVSGYGTTTDLYSTKFVLINARHFIEWLAVVETPFVVAGVLCLFVPRWFPRVAVARGQFLLAAWVAVVVLSYLFYQPFDAWWYLRFLLPMWPAAMLSTAAALIAIADRRVNGFALIGLALLLAGHGLYEAAVRGAFTLVRGERRYVDVSRFIATHTEPAAVMLSVQHSGSLRLYADRLTLRYTVLDPLWLDRTVEYLRSIGRHPYFVLDGDEVAEFKDRFSAANRSGRLDWQPMAMLGRVVSIYDPIERQVAAPIAIAQTRGSRGRSCESPQSWPPVRRMK